MTFLKRSATLALLLGTPIASFAQGALLPAGAPAPLFKSLDQLEPRAAINGPATLSQPGAYYLTGNITLSSGNGLVIAANGVSVDLNGFSITSTAKPASGVGVLISGSLTNIAIRNGFVSGGVTGNGAGGYSGSGFSEGISFAGNQPFNARVSDIAVSGCISNGISLNSNLGNNTGNTVDSCLVFNCGSYGISAETVLDCSVNGGVYAGIFSSTCARSRASSYSGIGLHAAVSAEKCFGESHGAIGVNASLSTETCYGVSSTSSGADCSGNSDACLGQTATGAYALSVGGMARDCLGLHGGPGGVGLILGNGNVAIGCVGITGGADGYGIYSGGILNGCVGIGATNALFKFKYNMP
ncbi:MAG: hypothetical protein HYR88_05065 [Verrucomicrobia bacterium]|nr:hypothetical protein [Verrucomicrobiota bacterium]MBI3871295.1 hypothetical protein [Verrucomicrobiota bacterium]